MGNPRRVGRGEITADIQTFTKVGSNVVIAVQVCE
jgi:hypothetical protein